MSTLAEIEKAIELLPHKEQIQLRNWILKKIFRKITATFCFHVTTG